MAVSKISRSTQSPPQADEPLIDPARLAINDVSSLSIQRQFIADRPIFIVDNVYHDPEYVRRLALSLQYKFSAGQYPGEMAFVSIYPAEIEQLVNQHYANQLKQQLRIHPHYRSLTFAIISRAGHELNPVQLQPHFDEFCDHAGVLYLNRPAQCSGGTSFWKHRPSGLEAAFPSNVARVHMAQSQKAGAAVGYPLQSNDVWQRLLVVPMKFNRLIIYDSLLFHSPHYIEQDFGESLFERRLGQNFYFDKLLTEGD